MSKSSSSYSLLNIRQNAVAQTEMRGEVLYHTKVSTSQKIATC